MISCSSQLNQDQKRQYETQIRELNDELEELQANIDSSNEKSKKTSIEMKKLSEDLNNERARIQQLIVRRKNFG